MLDKLKVFRDRFSEKTKLTIYIGAAVFVLLISALLPLAFRGEIITDGIFDTGERSVMFSKYISGDKSIRMKIDDKPTKAEVKYCEKVFDDMYERCILDNAVSKNITEGSEFITLSDGENSMRLCRMWMQNQGDWTNWLDIYIDAETGFVYYLYVSSICLDNGGSYYDAVDSGLSSRLIADRIASETGFGLKILNWSGNAEDKATAYTTLNGEAIIWDIYCSYYPSSMLDLKICVA